MSASPPKKQPKKSIHEFFKPYLKTVPTIPAKRPSPSVEETDDAVRPTKDESRVATPKVEKRRINSDYLRTPGTPARSPITPGTKASLSIRSRTYATTPVAPPSTYKHASIFRTDSSQSYSQDCLQNVTTPKLPSPAKVLLFADLPSSTQAVVKNGKVVEIRGSDGEDSDSLESLESLEDLFDRRRGGHTTSLSSTPGDDADKLEAERVKTLDMFMKGRPAPVKDKFRELRAKSAIFDFGLSDLLNDHLDDEKVESNVRKARADVQAATKSDGEILTKLDKKLLAAVATTEDGGNTVARLMDAVDRTEALSVDTCFLFFGVKGLNDWQQEEPVELPFPSGSIPKHLWRKSDNEARSRAYTSGYVSELAARRQVSDEGLKWTFENVVLEQQDEVRRAYIECMGQASSSWTRNNVSTQDVQTVFQTLGADNTSLQDSVEVKARHCLLKEPERRNPSYLLAALDLFRAICTDMDFAALSKLTSSICRLAIDAELMSDAQICSEVEDTLSTLLSLPDIELRTHVAERMLADVGEYLRDPTLQTHLLAHIQPTSPTATQIRILLAQVYLLGTKTSTFTAPKISLDTLALHITKSPHFDTRRRRGHESFDYALLRARVRLLDIAVSDGGPSHPFASRQQENEFNKSLDRLADAVEATCVNIQDSGASHMTRTEAKDDLRALHARLLFCVRTEQRPKRHIFDGNVVRDGEDVRGEERGKGFMKAFLERRLGKKEKEKENGQGGEEELIDEGDASALTRSESEKQIREQLGFK